MFGFKNILGARGGANVPKRFAAIDFDSRRLQIVCASRARNGACIQKLMQADIPENAPPEIRSLLRRCLQKDARKRFSSAGDMAYVLEDYLERWKTLEHQPKQKPSKETPGKNND